MCAHHPAFDSPRVSCFTCYTAAREALPSFVRPQQHAARPLTPEQIAHRARMLQHLAQSSTAESVGGIWPAACNGSAYGSADAGGRP